MAGIKALVTLAFLASLGVMFLILACALPRYNNWWPLFVLVFYVLAPLPNMCNRSDGSGNTSPRREFGWFITTIIIVSAFALPIVLARSPATAPVIEWGACWLVLAGNVVTFLTIFGFVMMADSDDIEYSM
ncbi:leptin receptor gene-related protein isoform X2 [Hyalella azteca]|nr:leptin receptor gene-related protein isoform X2 [Hyalella azteca]